MINVMLKLKTQAASTLLFNSKLRTAYNYEYGKQHDNSDPASKDFEGSSQALDVHSLKKVSKTPSFLSSINAAESTIVPMTLERD